MILQALTLTLRLAVTVSVILLIIGGFVIRQIVDIDM